MSVKIDLTGKQFGRLLVVSESFSDGKHVYWNCKCDCGKRTVVCGDSLKRGLTKSCGCFNSELASRRIKIHGKSKEKMYRTWQNMIYRCENEKYIEFNRYGGRGITVCEEWRNDFQAFYNWAMSNGYSDNLTIDRINVNGNYEPSNCQWITRSENSKKAWTDRKNDFGVI